MSETIKLTTAQAIVKFLDKQFLEVDGKITKLVNSIFTIYGHGNVVGLGEALATMDHDLKVMQGKNEQGMAHIATAFTRQKLRRELIAVTSSVGPGAANMITAAATATANNIPLLLLPGDTFATRQPDPVLQQMEFDHMYEQTTNDSFKSVCKYWDRINRPEQTMSALINAFQVLTNPATAGAVAICLPQDVQGEIYDFPSNFFEKRVHILERPVPTIKSIIQVSEEINKAKKPLVIIGGGVLYSEAQEEVKNFCENFKIPYALTQAGKGALPNDNYLNLGGLGVTGTKKANLIACKADLIIGIGTRYSDFTTASKSLFANKAKFVNINISRRDAVKLDAHYLTGDAKLIVKLLHQELDKLNYQSSYSNEITDVQNEWQEILKDLENYQLKVQKCDLKTVKDYINKNNEYFYQVPLFLKLQNLIKQINKKVIIVSAAGSLPGDLQRLWDVHQYNSYHVEYGYSCMGYEIQGAIGAKLAEPDAEVFAFVGDGSFLMLHSEMVTAIQENLKINILLFDNSGYGCIDNLQTSKGLQSNATHFRKRTNNKVLAGEFLSISYSQIAKAYGFEALKINNFEELDKSFFKTINSETSVLLEFKVLPKSMSGGYTWWRVGNPQISSDEQINEITKKDNVFVKNIKKY